MKVTFPVNQKTKCIKIPNALILNRFTFWILKLIFGLRFYPFLKVRYKHIKPVLKMAKSYNDFEIVSVKSRQGDEVRILL